MKGYKNQAKSIAKTKLLGFTNIEKEKKNDYYCKMAYFILLLLIFCIAPFGYHRYMLAKQIVTYYPYKRLSWDKVIVITLLALLYSR